jgi:hypothetical protein
MIKNLNRFAINKKVIICISFISFHFSSNGQTYTGDNIYIYGTSGSSSIFQNTGNDTSGINVNPTQTYISTNTNSGGSYTANSFIGAETTGVNIGSSGTVDLFVGAVDPTTGSITGTNGLSITSAYTAMFSVGSGSSTAAGWLSSSAAAITSANGILADSTGTYLQSATDLVLTGTTINLTGATNINTTGNYSTSIGSSGIGSVTMTSGSNSIALSNTLLTITAPTTIVGTTNINVTGSSSTTVGNTSGVVTIIGSTVSLGANSGSTVVLGNSSADSTISLNGQRNII